MVPLLEGRKKAELLELKYRIKKVPRLFVKTGNSMNSQPR
jgi:hypothetical protein